MTTKMPAMSEWPRSANFAVVADWNGISAVVYTETIEQTRDTSREFLSTVRGEIAVTAYSTSGTVVKTAYRH